MKLMSRYVSTDVVDVHRLMLTGTSSPLFSQCGLTLTTTFLWSTRADNFQVILASSTSETLSFYPFCVYYFGTHKLVYFRTL